MQEVSDAPDGLCIVQQISAHMRKLVCSSSQAFRTTDPKHWHGIHKTSLPTIKDY